MNLKTLIIISLLSILFIKCNIAPEYNLNFAPPPNSSWPEDIYPSQIEGIPAKAITKAYGGTEASYGPDKSIYIARFKDQQEAVSFFNQNILPEFKILSSNFNGTINGQFYANANGNGKKYFGWVNKRYIFVLKANSYEAFDKLINNFKYISKIKSL